jgi:hypothetical protein
MNNDFVDMGLDPAAYEALEKDFQDVILILTLTICVFTLFLGSLRTSRRPKHGEIQK